VSSEENKDYTFLCPECNESLSVNGPMRELLIDRGCVICGTSITESAFTKRSTS
jgi:hypothetical protein